MNKQYNVTISATNTVRIEAINLQEACVDRAKALELGVQEVFPYSASDVDYDIWHIEQVGDEEVPSDD